MSKHVRSITIEFERMPDIMRKVTLKFYYRDYSVVSYNHKHGRMMIVFLNNQREPEHKAFCHPDDTFSWETGMRLCVKRIGNPVLYRAFRRWIWLAKAVEECRKHIKPHGCDKCPDYDNDRSCRTLYQPHWWATPESIIAAEFGRVKVRVE